MELPSAFQKNCPQSLLSPPLALFRVLLVLRKTRHCWPMNSSQVCNVAILERPLFSSSILGNNHPEVNTGIPRVLPAPADPANYMCTCMQHEGPVPLNPSSMKLNTRLQTVFTPHSELLPRPAQYFGHYLTLFFNCLPSHRKMRSRNLTLHCLWEELLVTPIQTDQVSISALADAVKNHFQTPPE